MNAYYYRVLLPNGKLRNGIAQLAVERDFSARLWLEKRHEAVVVALYRLPRWLAEGARALGRVFRRGLRPEELSGLLRDLGVMTGSGVPMIDALRAIDEENHVVEGHSRVAAVAHTLIGDLDAGASISEAFSRHPDLFPESVRNLVQIGDATGTMDRMLIEAASHVERLGKMGRDARRSMIYPAFVFAAILGAAAFWVYYVIPNLAQLFKQMNAKLPPVTLAVLAVVDWLGAHLPLTITVLVVIIGGVWIGLRRSHRMRSTVHHLAHKLPVVRTIAHSSGMAFLTEHLALLIRAGLDLMRSLGVLERSMRDEYYRERIIAMRDIVARGERLSVAMRQVGGFPSMAVRMISVGEDTGTLDRQLQHLSGEYRQRLEHVIESLAEVIKPVVILLAGALFLLVVVAFLLPVYDLVRQAVTTSMN